MFKHPKPTLPSIVSEEAAAAEVQKAPSPEKYAEGFFRGAKELANESVLASRRYIKKQIEAPKKQQRIHGTIYCYLAMAPFDPPRVKIGWTTDTPEDRVEGNRTFTPCPLQLIAKWEGVPRAAEDGLHKWLEPHNIAGLGNKEWFFLEGYVAELLKEKGYKDER